MLLENDKVDAQHKYFSHDKDLWPCDLFTIAFFLKEMYDRRYSNRLIIMNKNILKSGKSTLKSQI